MRTRFLLVVLALAATALPAAPASAEPDKPYRVEVKTAVPAGATDTAYTVTITNEAKQPLGSANLTVPAGFTILDRSLSITRGTVSSSGNVLELRELSLPSGWSVKVTLGLQMPCVVPGTKSTWDVVAKQANDFNGTGNDFGPLSGTLSTTFTESVQRRCVVVPCNPPSCTATVRGAETTATVTGSGGSGTAFLLLALDLGRQPNCREDGYKPRTPDWYEFRTTAPRTKTVKTEYSEAAVQDIGGVSKLQICFAAPIRFAAKNGPARPFDYDGLKGNGAEGFVGLLPDCRYNPKTPCILKRESVGGDDHYFGGSDGRAIVTFLVPSEFGGPTGDPRYSP